VHSLNFSTPVSSVSIGGTFLGVSDLSIMRFPESKFFHDNAEKCQKSAGVANSEYLRSEWIEAARCWREIAQKVEGEPVRWWQLF
jgi:hypothetical protein